MKRLMMPKFRITVRVEDYWDYIVEEESDEAALERALIDFREGGKLDLFPNVDVEEVSEDTPLGDV